MRYGKVSVFAIIISMNTNILKALDAIAKLESVALAELYSGQNRINNVGTALEYFVKDVFCSSLDIIGLENKDKNMPNISHI